MDAHKYDYPVDPAEDNAANKVVHFVGQGKRVLDVGSGPGVITRLLKDPGGCRIVAVEIDPQAAAMVAQYCERVLCSDLNSASWIDEARKTGKFDVIVAADVLEHLYDPWEVLARLKSVLADDGYVVISLPHAGHQAVVASLLNSDFEYRDTGLLDRTHIRFFGLRNIQALIDQAGLTIVDASFVIRHPGTTDLAHQWTALPARLQRALRRARFGVVFQVVVKAVPSRTGVQGIDLCALPIPMPDQPPDPRGDWLERTLSPLVRRVLGQERRSQLRRALSRLGIVRRGPEG